MHLCDFYNGLALSPGLLTYEKFIEGLVRADT